jgi:hypothetical protein
VVQKQHSTFCTGAVLCRLAELLGKRPARYLNPCTSRRGVPRRWCERTPCDRYQRLRAIPSAPRQNRLQSITRLVSFDRACRTIPRDYSAGCVGIRLASVEPGEYRALLFTLRFACKSEEKTEPTSDVEPLTSLRVRWSSSVCDEGSIDRTATLPALTQARKPSSLGCCLSILHTRRQIGRQEEQPHHSLGTHPFHLPSPILGQ